MSIDAFDTMSLDEIRQRLQNIDNDRAALERALEVKKQQTKKELAQEIRDRILSQDYDIGEILELIGSKRRPAVARAKPSRAYTRYVDPENPDNVYVRGVLPRWMKEQMAARGLNAKSKEDREAFKEQYLQKQDG